MDEKLVSFPAKEGERVREERAGREERREQRDETWTRYARNRCTTFVTEKEERERERKSEAERIDPSERKERQAAFFSRFLHIRSRRQPSRGEQDTVCQ